MRTFRHLLFIYIARLVTNLTDIIKTVETIMRRRYNAIEISKCLIYNIQYGHVNFLG